MSARSSGPILFEMIARATSALAGSALLLGCAAPMAPMSVEQHERAAAESAQLAESHEAEARADDPQGCVGAPGIYTVCWPSIHHEEAQDHRRLAAKHREAAADLRAAEERACKGIAPDERDISPFMHFRQIRTVAVEKSDPELVGTVTFEPVRGLTAASLQAIADCHLARNAAMGHEVPEMDYCPLVPAGVRARAKDDGDHVVVELRVAGLAAHAEARRRLEALAARVWGERAATNQ